MGNMAVGEAQGRISGQIIIEQLIRNMELGQFEMGYSILVPCIFSLYLHPDDYTRLTGVFDLIREDAKKALASRLAQLNGKPLGGLPLGLGRCGREGSQAVQNRLQRLGLRVLSRF